MMTQAIMQVAIKAVKVAAQAMSEEEGLSKRK